MRYYIILLLVIFATKVSATHFCEGKILEVDMTGTGEVLASIENMNSDNKLCVLGITHGIIIPEACQAIYSTLLVAKSTNKKVRVHFRDDTNTSCNKGQGFDFADSEFYYFSIAND